MDLGGVECDKENEVIIIMEKTYIQFISKMSTLILITIIINYEK